MNFNYHRVKGNKLKIAGAHTSSQIDAVLSMGIALGMVEEFIRLRNMTSPDGMWLMPRVDSHIWDAVYFCRKGPHSPSIIRFFIDDQTVMFESGAKIKTPIKLAEDPEAFQLFIKEKCDNGEIQYDKNRSFQYDVLYASDNSESCIVFDDKISLKELCNEVSSIEYQ